MAIARAAEGRSLASPTIKALISRRSAELIGLGLGLLGLALLVALACYDPRDPSLNTATSRHTSNLAGPVGAVLADLLLQGFGVAGALPGRGDADVGVANRIAPRAGQHGGPAGGPARGLACAGRGAGQYSATADACVADGGGSWGGDRLVARDGWDHGRAGGAGVRRRRARLDVRRGVRLDADAAGIGAVGWRVALCWAAGRGVARAMVYREDAERRAGWRGSLGCGCLGSFGAGGPRRGWPRGGRRH